MTAIRVMSRAELAERLFDRPVAVISIRSPDGPRVEIPQTPYVKDVLQLEFEDVDDPAAGLAMSDEQAQRILDFVRTHIATDIELVCQCEAGVSRSAGVAAALSRIHFGHDGGFHRTHRPNPWVRRRLLLLARAGGGTRADAPPASSAPGEITSQVTLLPTALPTAVLVREGRTWVWAPRIHRDYPAGTLGGDVRTLGAHVFIPLAAEDGRIRSAREVGTWARRALHENPGTDGTHVITRAGSWREKVGEGEHPRVGEAALEVYVQTAAPLTRDAWTRALRTFADTVGHHFRPRRFDIVLVEDGLMYKRAVWRAEGEDAEESEPPGA